MSVLWIPLQVASIAFLGLLLLIVSGNRHVLHRLGDYPLPSRYPFVSVLVPARNEEANIGPCVRSLLAQEYPNLEVLVLDDGSEDRTARILSAIAGHDDRLRLLNGTPVPPDWVGKNWACHQLAEAARGELLLFTDADTRHHPRALVDAVAALEAEEADLLTAFPHQEVGSWAERLIVPAMTHSFSSLPLGLAFRSPSPALSITIGQFMLFRRRAYEQIGGYQAVRGEVADDTVLGRNIKSHGLRWRLIDGGPRISCRMYHNLHEIVAGYGKNLFPGFGCRLLTFAFAWSWVALGFLEPLVVLALWLAGVAVPGLAAALAAGGVGIALLLWSASLLRFRFPLYLAPLYPLTVLLGIGIAAWSVVVTVTGRSAWKGRPVVRQKVRLW